MENSSENYDSASCNEDSDPESNSTNTNLIFMPNKKIEDEVKEKCGVPNWGSMIFGLFNQSLRKKLIETSKINEGYYNFILGVQQEYGIDCEINLARALQHYTKASQLKETYALHKLYNIYCYEYEKFQVARDRQKELFFIFQSIAYSDASFFINNDTFFKIDISYEISLICELEENFYQKFTNMFDNIKELESDPDEIMFIESFISLKYLSDKHDVDYTKQLECVEKLKKLAEKNHLEASYKLAVVFRMTDKFYSEFLFRQCIKEKFSKSYLDYGLFLYSEEKHSDALRILKEGMELGNFRCNFIYYDLFLSLLDFEKDYLKLIDLSEVLVADILIGNVFSVFDFFFKRKILIKYFKIPIEKLYNENISDLLEITSKSITDKEMIMNNFAGNIVFTELLLSHGFLKYIGACGKTDYKLAEKCLKESFKTSGNNSYKRFCYSYLFKIRMRRLGFKKQKIYGDMLGDYYSEQFGENELKKNMLINNDYNKIQEDKQSKSNKDKYTINFTANVNNNDHIKNEYGKDAAYGSLVNKDYENKLEYLSKDEEKALEEKKTLYDDKEIFIGNKITKTKNKLYKIYNDSIIEGNLQDFSSSYFYFMGKIFENGWGCKQDEITAYCYYIHGKEAKIKSLGTGSVISYYRRFKSVKKLDSERYKNAISSLEKVKGKILQALDEKECFICFENEKNTVLFPCKHMMCFGCYNQIKDTARCPTCRTKILLVR